MPWNPEHYNMKTEEVIKILEENKLTSVGKKMKPKIIHTKTFSCADDHPIVYYTFDDNNKAICEYCSAQFVYESESDDPDYRYGDFRDEIMAVEKIREKTK